MRPTRSSSRQPGCASAREEARAKRALSNCHGINSSSLRYSNPNFLRVRKCRTASCSHSCVQQSNFRRNVHGRAIKNRGNRGNERTPGTSISFSCKRSLRAILFALSDSVAIRDKANMSLNFPHHGKLCFRRLTQESHSLQKLAIV